MNNYDRYEILRSLFAAEDNYAKNIVENSQYTYEQKRELIQRNDIIYQGVVDRLLEI